MSGSIKLMAVGDIMLGDAPYCDGFGVGSHIKKRGALFPFEPCQATLKKADLLFGNLEVVISAFEPDRLDFNQTIFRAKPEAIEGLQKTGFDILSLATNHIMQHGRQALIECQQLLSRATIATTGIAQPELGSENLKIIKIKNITTAFLGYNQRPQQYFIDPPDWVTGEPDQIISDIIDAKHKADHVIVSIHWGDEFISYPSAKQVELGRRMIDAGASLILGHHPHVLQGIEKYNKGVIAYSLGNFVFDMDFASSRPTIILSCDLGADGSVDIETIPCSINDHWQPVILTGQEALDAIENLKLLSEKISTETDQAEYLAELKSLEDNFRNWVYRWYLSNLHRYSLKRLIANFGRTIRNRLFKS